MRLKLILTGLLITVCSGVAVSASEIECLGTLNQALIISNNNETVNSQYFFNPDESTCILDKGFMSCYDDYRIYDSDAHKEAVAVIGISAYKTLEEAVLHANNGHVIKILKDIEINKTINIEGKEVAFVNVSDAPVSITRKQDFTGPLFCVSDKAWFSFGEDPANRKEERSRIVLDGQNRPNCKPMIVVENSSIAINYCELCNKITKGNGGGIYDAGSSGITLYKSSIHDCVSGGNGGAVFIVKGSDVDMSMCRGLCNIYSNFALGKGAAFYCADGDMDDALFGYLIPVYIIM